ncbi:HPP family protein [Deefgea salmonis]|uniref:HPP family protein n=1 Tax=Deefgea salmonis TaxID=2875502 RepID=A0ABS8BP56_9NEIS|nr:HPP family protein [Deefgea salmonis]MCB5197514.1 HPP family protein [Deefgea salmonis]
MAFKFCLKSNAPPVPSIQFVLISLLGAVLAIGITAWLSKISGFSWLMAPFGASCVLVFGLPDSPLAQPRSVIGGHLITTLVGLTMLYAVGDFWWSEALAVGLALALMQITRTVHAPAGANPLLVMATHPGFGFLITPVLLGALSIVGVGYLMNNLRQRGSYPRYWF